MRWDIDRYGEMQDRAWHLDSLGAEQNHVAANELRTEAAQMLSTYWDVLRLPDADEYPWPRPN